MRAVRPGASLTVLALLAGCIPIWTSQYRIMSSDGTVAINDRYSSYGALKYKTDDGADLELMVDADHGSTGMLVAFTATVPTDSNPGIEANEIQLLDCPPNKPGPLKIDYVASHP